MNTKAAVLNCGMSILGLAIATELHAQAPSRGIEEVVVTAQKRAESAQEVPIAIDVVSADTFIREGIRDLKDIQKTSTELEINFNQGTASVIGVRGMQQSGFAQTTDPLTAVHLDGAYLASFYGLNGLMFDLDRIEVLAGPQGTLYGRNSAAGAVNLITKRPGSDFEANGMVEYGSENTIRLGGGVSFPVSDSFSLRVAGQKYTRDALFNDGASEQDQWAARISAVWKPTTSDEIFATVDYGKFGGTNDATTLLGLNYDARLANGAVPTSVSNYANLSTLKDPYDVLPYLNARGLIFFGNNQQENSGAMVQYTHDFGGFSSVLQYGYREIGDAVSRAHTRTPAQASGNLLTVVQKTNTAEFRLLSETGGGFEWVGGLFYFDSTSKGWNATPTNVIINGAPDPVTGLNIPWCPCNNNFYPNYGDAWSYAIFGQGTWTPAGNDALHITAGVRYSKDWKNAHLGYWSGGVPVFVFGLPGMDPRVQALFAPSIANGTIVDGANGDNNREWDNVQYKLGVEYSLSDESMIYGSIATGYKSGAITFGATPVLKPEDLLAYEIGTKNRFLDNTLQVNASLWYYDYTDFEANAQRPLITPVLLPNGTFQTTLNSTTNVAEAGLAGVSTDIDWLATDSDQFGISVTYVWSEIKDGTETVPPCAAVLQCSLVAPGTKAPIFNEGARLGDAPEWQILGRYSHTFMFSSGAVLNPGLKYQWQSEKWDQSTRQDARFYPDFKLNKFTEIPSRGILDLSLKFAPQSGQWDVTGYVNNATDELNIRTLSYDANPANATFGQITGTIGEPRTYGVILTARFE